MSAANPGMDGAATAEGVAASTIHVEQPQQPAPPDPMAGQQQAPGWKPGVGRQMFYPDGMGPISGRHHLTVPYNVPAEPPARSRVTTKTD